MLPSNPLYPSSHSSYTTSSSSLPYFCNPTNHKDNNNITPPFLAFSTRTETVCQQLNPPYSSLPHVPTNTHPPSLSLTHSLPLPLISTTLTAIILSSLPANRTTTETLPSYLSVITTTTHRLLHTPPSSLYAPQPSTSTTHPLPLLPLSQTRTNDN